MDQLTKAQMRLEAMSRAAASVAKSFNTVGAGMKNLAQEVKKTGVSFSAAFNEQGVIQSFNLIGKAAEAASRRGASAMQGINDASRQMNAEFKEYIASMTRPNEGLKKMGAYYRELEKASASAHNAAIKEVNARDAQLKQLQVSLYNTGQNARMVSTLLSQAFSPFILQRFITKLVEVRGEFELAQKSLGVIIGNADRAHDMFNEITQIAIRSPFSVSDILEQTKQLAAYRIETDKLIETTKMLGDISAGVGVDMNRLILAYGQVKAAEFLKGTELRQFSEAGVNMLGGLADRFTEIYGRVVSVGEVMQMVSKRMVKFADVEAVLKSATEIGGAFYKMQEQQADTIRGRISNLQDRIQIMFNEIGKSYDSVIGGIITGLESVISHWRAISAIVMPLLAGKLFSGGLALVINRVSRLPGLWNAVRYQITLANMATTQMGKNLNVLRRGVNSLRGAWAAIGWQSALSALIAISALVAQVVINASKFRNEIKRIAEESTNGTARQIDRFNELLDVAVDVNNKERDRLRAVETLKTEYGNVLDLQRIELGNIDQLNADRQKQIDLIQMQAAEEARVKALNEAIEDLQSNAAARRSIIYNSINNQTGAGDFFDTYRDSVKGLIDVTADDANAAAQKVERLILNGTIQTAEEASNEYIRMILVMAGAADDEIERIISTMDRNLLSKSDQMFEKVARRARVINNEFSKQAVDTTYSIAARPYLKAIDEIENVRKKFQEKPEYTQNPQQRELDYYEYLKNWKEEISKAIDGGALGDIADNVKERLQKDLDRAFTKEVDMGGTIEQYLRDVGAQINKQFPDMITPLGVGKLKKAEETDMEKYAQQIADVVEEYRKAKTTLETGEETFLQKTALALQYGTMNIDEAVRKLDYSINALEHVQEIIGPIQKTTNTPGGNNNGASSYKSDLKAFLSTLKSARKEMDKLTDEEDKIFVDRLRSQAKKIGIVLGKEFVPDDKTLDSLIDKYLPKLSESDRLELKLTWSKEDTADALKEMTDEVSRLWRQYDNSKKMEDWGFLPREGTTEEILDKILLLEDNLRAKDSEEAIRAAEEIKEKRLEIFRDEQEEAAKIAYEANKKSLDKIGQAYQEMQKNIAKIRTDGGMNGEEKQRAINNQIAKSMKEISKAQWDAYKGSQEYALAFGDVEGLSSDVLSSLKESLQYWKGANQSMLTATEIHSIERALAKINAAMQTTEVKTYFGALKDGFSQLGEARKIAAGFKDLEAAASDAMDQVAIARADRDAMKQLYDMDASKANLDALTWAESRLAEAEERRDKTVQNLKDAHSDYNTALENSSKKLGKIEAAYRGLESMVSNTIGLAKDTIEALGGEIDSTTQAGIDGLKTAISLVGSAISLGKGAIETFAKIEEMENLLGVAKTAVLGPFLVAVLAIGAALAILKMRDAALEKQVEEHKKNVEKLEKAYEKLEKAMDKALDLSDARQSYAEMNANLAKQRQELDEAISANNSRKQTEKVREETEELQESLDALDDKVEETRDKWLEMLGAPTDYQGIARDWSSGWLEAFKETGSGLDALHESFDELYDDLVVGQLWSQVMGPQIENLQQMVKDALADGDLTDSEAAAIRAFKNTLAITNEDLERRARELGISGGALSGDTLQRGVETVTEKTAEALEAILNSTRYDVSDTNARLARMETGILGEGENTIMSQLRSQTRYLADIARIASAVYFPGGHPRGAGALKVVAEIA